MLLANDPTLRAERNGNLCRYVHNNPINFIDPSGLQEKSPKPDQFDAAAMGFKPERGWFPNDAEGDEEFFDAMDIWFKGVQQRQAQEKFEHEMEAERDREAQLQVLKHGWQGRELFKRDFFGNKTSLGTIYYTTDPDLSEQAEKIAEFLCKKVRTEGVPIGVVYIPKDATGDDVDKLWAENQAAERVRAYLAKHSDAVYGEPPYRPTGFTNPNAPPPAPPKPELVVPLSRPESVAWEDTANATMFGIKTNKGVSIPSGGSSTHEPGRKYLPEPTRTRAEVGAAGARVARKGAEALDEYLLGVNEVTFVATPYEGTTYFYLVANTDMDKSNQRILPYSRVVDEKLNWIVSARKLLSAWINYTGEHKSIHYGDR